MKLFAREARGRAEKGSVERVVREQAEALSLVCRSILDEEFLQYCVEALPAPSGRRDIRRQSLIRSMRRMHERGDLPFAVEGRTFVLG